MHITTLGIDLAKNVFQLHGVDARGHAVLSRRVKRSQLVEAVASLPPCVIGMEACGSAHHWGRAFEQLGHTVKLMSPKYVKPYVKTNKNDARDAEAICEAVSRPTMRCVSIKTVEQADLQALHRTRTLLVKHRTAVINQIRGLLAEYGLVIAPSPEKVRPAVVRFLDDAASGLTAFARETFAELYEQLTGARVAHRASDAPGGGRVPGASSLPEIGRGAGDWSVDGHGTGGDRRSAPGVSQRPASGGVVGAGASAILQWGQGQVRRDFETRQSVCADAADSWGASRRAACRAEGGYAGAVAVGAQTPQRHQCRRSGLSQQKRPGDLGLVGP